MKLVSMGTAISVVQASDKPSIPLNQVCNANSKIREGEKKNPGKKYSITIIIVLAQEVEALSLQV